MNKKLIKIYADHDYGDMVFLKTCRDQYERIVVSICQDASRTIEYQLRLGTTESWHQAIEITKDKNYIKTTTN